MATVLFNPTNEELKGQWTGIDFVIPANGGKLKVEDACAKHLTNFLGPRGLTTLEYGDEDREEEISKASIARNREFKKKQLKDFNVRNEQRKQQNLEYLLPSEQIKAYSKELGIDLVEPYATKVEGMAEVAEALKSKDKVIELLENQVKDMNEKFDLLMNEVSSLKEEEGSKDKKGKR